MKSILSTSWEVSVFALQCAICLPLLAVLWLIYRYERLRGWTKKGFGEWSELHQPEMFHE